MSLAYPAYNNNEPTVEKKDITVSSEIRKMLSESEISTTLKYSQRIPNLKNKNQNYMPFNSNTARVMNSNHLLSKETENMGPTTYNVPACKETLFTKKKFNLPFVYTKDRELLDKKSNNIENFIHDYVDKKIVVPSYISNNSSKKNFQLPDSNLKGNVCKKGGYQSNREQIQQDKVNKGCTDFILSTLDSERVQEIMYKDAIKQFNIHNKVKHQGQSKEIPFNIKVKKPNFFF